MPRASSMHLNWCNRRANAVTSRVCAAGVHNFSAVAAKRGQIRGRMLEPSHASPQMALSEQFNTRVNASDTTSG
eukprot:m.950867 g.950867  ORF g.950867 m.950867 type:complete len:74 (-) comp23861_c1_seq22:2943-3164(-)